MNTLVNHKEIPVRAINYLTDFNKRDEKCFMHTHFDVTNVNELDEEQLTQFFLYATKTDLSLMLNQL